jgi:cytochrome bd ubiquinol oxidase subunit II
MFLINLWMGLVALVVILYVVLDGFSLGVGILFPFARSEKERDIMMDSIGPVWDANQTWIVFGGGALFATFPLIYTVLFSALYIPLFTFLFGLIFRGVAFEFRANSSSKTRWNRAFFIGSLVATIAQGVTIGAYISGIRVQAGFFAGGAFDWLQPFSLMVGVALIAGYVLLGATYLIIKTTGAMQARAFQQAVWAAWAVAGFMVLVSIWTPFHTPDIIARWLSPPRINFIWVFPVMGLLSFGLLLKSLKQRREVQPFVFALLFFISAYLGLQAGIYPYAILPDVTLAQAAAQRETMIFTLVGVAVVLPMVLGYTVYSYWVFRGKVTAEGAGYH